MEETPNKKEEEPKKLMKVLAAATLWHKAPAIPGGPTPDPEDKDK